MSDFLPLGLLRFDWFLLTHITSHWIIEDFQETTLNISIRPRSLTIRGILKRELLYKFMMINIIRGEDRFACLNRFRHPELYDIHGKQKRSRTEILVEFSTESWPAVKLWREAVRKTSCLCWMRKAASCVDGKAIKTSLIMKLACGRILVRALHAVAS